MNPLLKFPALLICLCLNSNLFSQITVGEIVNGEPVLTLTDAELTDSLSSVLNGATLSNSVAESATDTLGLYYYIKSTATRPGQASSNQIIIILSPNGNFLQFDTDSGCAMECHVVLPCSACDQVIFEKCKRQRCKCTGESGGCSSSITFPD